ncbi:MAG: 6-bladed beta-propeller [Clostridiales bacterium]|nr:6-bladed beta-propeller [Clostridiales bacterium]
MKNHRMWLFWVVTGAAALLSAAQDSLKPLAEIYKGGTVRFVPELVLDESSLPEEAFFESVVDIKLDPDGSVYFCDYKANNIKKFDATGRYLKTIGRKGQGPGEFNMPFCIAVTAERLIVWDMGNRRLSQLTPDGSFLKSIPFQFGQGRPERRRCLPDGNIVIGMEKTYFGEENRPQDYSIEIYSSDLEHKNTIYTQQVWRNRYIRIEKGTTNIPQPFTPMVYWDVSPDGKIIIGHSKNYEIEVHSSEKGRLFSFRHTYEPVKVTEKDKEMFFAGMVTSVGGVTKPGAPDYIVKNTEFPKEKPAFFDILVDSDGNILVSSHRKKREEESTTFDAFTPQGKFIGAFHVAGPTRSLYCFRGAAIRQGLFWAYETGEEGSIKIIKYRISG